MASVWVVYIRLVYHYVTNVGSYTYKKGGENSMLHVHLLCFLVAHTSGELFIIVLQPLRGTALVHKYFLCIR